ncbi:hypothetical protein N431DRAFT_462140 [Stipitochalara longipes BDJ]|nr:hypothetical protein N431DRAFT_462140 [Stipitochalara longipes BDJ]
MRFFEELRRYFARVFNAHPSGDSSPPPYTPSQSALLQSVPDYTATANPIMPTDTPQWVWTNAECKEWLFAVCYENLGLSGEESKAISDNFDGFGPVIYCMDQTDWKKLLGTNHRANGVYAMVYNLMSAPGAVPPGLIIKHPRDKSRRGKVSQP